MKSTLLKPLLTRREVADWLNLGIRTVDGLIKSGELRTVKVGTRFIRIPAESVEAYVATVSEGGGK